MLKNSVVTNVACINLQWVRLKESVFSFSNQEKEAFSGTSWTLSPLEDKMSLN